MEQLNSYLYGNNDFETLLENSLRLRHVNRLKHRKDKRTKKIYNPGFIKITKNIISGY